MKKNHFLKLMYMATSHCLQPENQAIKREEEKSGNMKKRGKKC